MMAVVRGREPSVFWRRARRDQQLAIQPVGPALPLGAIVRVPGRGDMFVRYSAGPPGAPTVLLLHGWMASSDLNGPGTSYQVITLVNGDRIFARANIVSHNLSWNDKSKKGAENRVAGPITGGTGKFVSIRGTMRNASHFDPKTGSNDSRFDLEYWIQAQH